MIEWPMNILSKQAGESRKLVCHPRPLLSRDQITVKGGEYAAFGGAALPIFKRTKKITLWREEKLQGHRHFYSRDARGYYKMHGRRLNVNGEYPDIFDSIEGMPLPSIERSTVLDGELIWPGHPDSSVPTAIKECPNELRFKVFSIPIYKGVERMLYSYLKGRNLLLDILDSEYIVRCGIESEFTPENMDFAMSRILNIAAHRGLEGWVLKGSFCKDWWKVKLISEMDVFVIGLKTSKSDTKYGKVTAVRIGMWEDSSCRKIIDMGSVCGFNDEEMEKMTECYDRFGSTYRHRVLRVQYQEIASKGKLKHAFFDGWRKDKSYKECYQKE